MQDKGAYISMPDMHGARLVSGAPPRDAEFELKLPKHPG
jgi:hypothetical protein